MELCKSLENLDFLGQSAVLWQHYKDRQLKLEYEPNWVHEGYDLFRRVLDKDKLDHKEFWLAKEIIKSHSLPDGFAVPLDKRQPQSEQRIMHDGWKAGSATWIFMGRNLDENSVVSLSESWIAIKRTLPPEIYSILDPSLAPDTLWMAYNKNKQIKVLDESITCVGPAIYFEELVNFLENKNEIQK
jgi:hypothetical protein